MFRYHYNKKNKNPHRFSTHRAVDTEDIKLWIKDNIGLKRDKCYIWSQSNSDKIIVYIEVHIKDEADAMAFKLRWV